MTAMQQSKEDWAAQASRSDELSRHIEAGIKSIMKWGLGLLALSFAYHVATAPEEKDMTFEQSAQHSKFTAERECDRAAKRRVKNPSSYDSDSPTRTVQDGREWVVFANFRAMNDFGAMLDHHFVCRYDFMRKALTEIEITRGLD